MMMGSALLAAMTLAGAGCGTGSTPRDLMVEEVHSKDVTERPVAMRGEATFLEGKLAAMATVTRGFERQGRGGPGQRSRFEDEDASGRRRRDAGMGEVYNIGYGDSEEEQKEAYEDYMRIAKMRRAQGSPMPPVTLRVLLENKGTEPMEVEVTEVNSDLGNFAVRPRSLTLAPGEKGVLDPMISQLGVTSDEIPLKLAVRVAGKKELQVVTVKNIILPSVRK